MDSFKFAFHPLSGTPPFSLTLRRRAQAFGIVYLQTRRFTPEHYGVTYISLFVGFLLGGLLIVTVGGKLSL